VLRLSLQRYQEKVLVQNTTSLKGSENGPQNLSYPRLGISDVPQAQAEPGPDNLGLQQAWAWLQISEART
jgi:hypothetical protein